MNMLCIVIVCVEKFRQFEFIADQGVIDRALSILLHTGPGHRGHDLSRCVVTAAGIDGECDGALQRWRWIEQFWFPCTKRFMDANGGECITAWKDRSK